MMYLSREQGRRLQAVVSRISGRSVYDSDAIADTVIEALECIAERLEQLENRES